MIISVATASDPRLAPYTSVRERDLIRDQRFIVEGAITLGRLLTSPRYRPESILISEVRALALAAVLARADPALPVYVASQQVMDGVAGFHLHRGVLAVALRVSNPAPRDLLAGLGPVATVLSLLSLANHDNVGACFRNAAAFGVDAILMDETSADPLYRKSIRVSAGAALSLPFSRSGDGASLLAALDEHGLETWALSPREGEPLQSLAPPPRLALMLGAEGPGLPAALMDRARRVTIPMSSGLDSLNVATAGAIALAHVFAQRMSGA